MKSSKILMIIFAVVNLIIIGTLGYTWDWFYFSYNQNFQLNLQYFLFLFAHLSSFWALLQVGWILSWSSSHYSPKNKKNALFRILILVFGLSIVAWSGLALFIHYYQRGQQSSWIRIFNLNDQIVLFLAWASVFILPLLILLLINFWQRYRLEREDVLYKQKKFWLAGFYLVSLALLIWGMILSYRNATILSNETYMTAHPINFTWIAIYNPFSAIVALLRSVFSSIYQWGDIVVKHDMYFSRTNMLMGNWPSFFQGLFWGKLALMAFVSILSLFFSFLLHLQHRKKDN